MSTEETLNVLRGTPTSGEIDSATQSLLEAHLQPKDQLQVIITYLKHIIPVYHSIKTPVKLKIRTLFYSCMAVSNLLSQYRITKNEAYFQFTVDLLMDPALLVSLIGSCNGSKTELQQVKSLMFGSKLLQTFEGELAIDEYLSVLSKQLVEACQQHKQSPEYFLSYLSLHPVEAKMSLFKDFFTQKNFPLITTSFKEMSSLQKRRFTCNYLIPYLALHTNVNNIDTIASIINCFNIRDVERHALDKMAEVDHMELQQAMVFIARDKLAHAVRLLMVWGNEVYINDFPATKQETMTRLILILLQYPEKDQLDSLARDKIFLSAITARISSNDIKVRNLGMMVAKRITSGEIKFDIEDEIKLSMPVIKLSTIIDFSQLHIQSFANLTISPEKATQVDSDDEESDSESDDESPADPVFLKDLIKRFTENSTTSLTHLLQLAVKLVRQKAAFGSELEFYSPELLAVLAGLMNKYEEKNFEELKLNAIVSVIVSNPLIIKNIYELLFTGDYSLQQRMIILSSIGLSARELRGLDDEIIDKPQFDFPTSEIPHRKKLIEEVQEPKIQELEDHMGQGTVLRKSTALTKEKPKPKPNLFAKHAQKFFHPLANGWAAGANSGSFNETFRRHYLSTMHIVLQASYPSYGFEEMAEVYEQIRDSSSIVI